MKFEFKNHHFKIMQIADTQDGTHISPDTLALINAAIEKEKPDLIVYSGDQIWGKSAFRGSRKKAESSLKKLTEPAVSAKIPFAVCFGNHDRQIGLTNEEQFEIYKKFPYFAGENISGADGCANQVIEINENGKTKFLLYLIDSHSNLKIGYDNVHKNQIDWYKRTRDEYEKKYGYPIPSIVIQHIPVPEVMKLLNEVPKKTKGAVQGFRNHTGKWYVLNKDKVNKNGFMKESPADPMENSGEFEAMAEKGDVKGIYFGHDHNNSFNGKVGGIDLGYTQGAGFHVYGPGLDRGVRIINLKSDGSFDTYDLRYRDLIGKKVKEKLHFAVLQIMPTNMFDAINRAVKIVGAIAGIAAATALIALLLKK
ncbi:MAG: metallophosphoesterase family protein [Clostridiales bacterium]|nr:metallophosphoesterase family protein [Clostridiales bacterium]